MNPIKKVRLCEDNIKYLLMGVVSPCIDQYMYVRKRQLLYSNGIYHIYLNNKNSNFKAKNIYAILYSKYFTQRFMMQELNNEIFFEDDEEIKKRFKNLIESEIASSIDLQNKYLEIVKSLKELAIYEKYVKIDELMRKNSFSKNEYDMFYVGTNQTDAFLEKKLLQDIHLFHTNGRKILDFLNEYKFINGWLTAGGIWTIGIIAKWFS